MTQYIDKSTLSADIDKRKNLCEKIVLDLRTKENKDYYQGKAEAYSEMSELIDTLEVKEVEQNLWKHAGGDDLPEIDREVIALLSNGKVVYAHRPNPDGWDGKNILTGDVRHYDIQTYDKGGWNQPNIKWWLDLDLPEIEC